MRDISRSFVSDPTEFERSYSELQNIFDPTKRLPGQVYRAGYGDWRFMDFSYAISPDFWNALRRTSALFGDETIYFCLLDPDSKTYFRRFRHFGHLHLRSSEESDAYSEAMFADPGNSPADALQHIASTACWWGNSLNWGFWGERDFGIVVGGRRGDVSGEWLQSMPQAMTSSQIALNNVISLEFRDRLVPSDFRAQFSSNYGPL